jgi:hypothetical protein
MSKFLIKFKMLRSCRPKALAMVYKTLGYIGKRICLPLWKGEAMLCYQNSGLLLAARFFSLTRMLAEPMG